MMDISATVTAVRQLNQIWTSCSKGIEQEDLPAEVYNSVCEIDEAIITLVEKIGLYAKAHTVFSIYGDSGATENHRIIVERQ
jgi:hypothetical protein